MSPRQSVQSVDDYDEERIPRLTGRYSRSVERGLAILGWFTPQHPVQGIAEIGDGLGMSRSTTHRYVTTLVALGFMEHAGSSRKYRLRLRVTDLGMSALSSTGLRVHARPYLEELRQRTMFTTSLAVMDGTEVLYVDRARSLRGGQNKVDYSVRVGSRLPAYCTALGKVLLAGLPKREQRGIISEIELVKRGPHTITSKRALYSELERVSEEGVGVDDEEFAAGFVAVSVPVRDEAREVVAAVDLAAHASIIALEELVDALGPHLVATADHISARLGYRRDDETWL